MKNRIKSYIIGGAIVLSSAMFTGCSDFLSKDKLGQETSETYFVTQEKAVASLAAAYSDITDYRFQWHVWSFGETLSDNAIYGGSEGDSNGFEPLKSFNGTSDMSQPRYKWQITYRGINKASQTIEGIQGMSDNLFESVEVKNRLIAEARFLRAFYHYELVRAFGNIPLVDHLVTTPTDRITQSEPAEVFAFIISELKLAAEDLPEKSEYESEDLGRITKGAAHAYIAKASMYIENWTDMETYADMVIASGEYQLEADYANIFTLTNEHGAESIFEVSFFDSPTMSSAYTNNGNFQTLFQLPRNLTYGYGINLPTQSLYDAYIAEGDTARLRGTILTDEQVFAIELADEYADLKEANASGDAEAIAEAEAAVAEGRSTLTYNLTGFYNKKLYLGPNERSVEIRNNPNNVRMMRIGEVYLLSAEAKAQLGDADALQRLNELRSVRGLEAKTVSGNDLLEAIYTERRLELGMENDRYYDLVRLGKAEGLLPGWTEAHKYWPVPQNEVDNSDGDVVQNPGYN